MNTVYKLRCPLAHDVQRPPAVGHIPHPGQAERRRQVQPARSHRVCEHHALVVLI